MRHKTKGWGKRKLVGPGRGTLSFQSKYGDAKQVCLVCLKRFDGPGDPGGGEVIRMSTLSSEESGTRVKQEERDPLAEDLEPEEAEMQVLKEGKGEVNALGGGLNIYMRFLTIAERYLQLRTTKRFRTSAASARGNGVMASPFCAVCSHSVRKLCEAYAEWKNVRLTLLWRLGQFGEAIQHSNVNVNLSGRLDSKLLRALSRQLNVPSQKLIILFRRELRLRCLGRVKSLGCSPTVSIDRNSCLNAMKDKLTFPIQEMQKAMISLIVIFTLATSETAKREPPEIKKEVKTEISCKAEGMRHHLKEGNADIPVAAVDNGSEDGDNNMEMNDEFGGASDSDWDPNKEEAINKSHIELPSEPLRRSLRTRTGKVKFGENTDSEDDLKPTRLSLKYLPSQGHRGEVERKFSCNICNRRFITAGTLRKHLTSHPFILPYSCKRCAQRFRRHLDLIAHKKEVHASDGPRVGSGIAISAACTICQEVFPSQVKLWQHRRTSHRHTCGICRKSISGDALYARHMEGHDRRKYGCPKCPRYYRSEQGLKMHIVFHDANPNWIPKKEKGAKLSEGGMATQRQFKCEAPECERSFFTQSSLDIHTTFHATSFTCSLCNEKFPEYREIYRHLMDIHENTQVGISQYCLHCNKCFIFSQTLDIHKRFMHPYLAKLSCEVGLCKNEFDTTDELRQHIKEVHLPPDVIETTEDLKEAIALISSNVSVSGTAGAAEGLFTCKYCKWCFPTRERLVHHLLVHSERDEKGLYNCTLCAETFTPIRQFQSHFNRLHLHGFKQHSCSICQRSFVSTKGYRSHLKSHQVQTATIAEEPETESNLRHRLPATKKVSKVEISCDECSEQFKCKSSLFNHKHKVHGLEKPIPCTYEGCTKRFFDQKRLRDHQVGHQEGKFQCPLCPRKLLRKKYLEQHILVHKQEKNYTCQFCGRSFVKKLGLDIHLDIHLGNKKYKCSYCDKAFCRKFARDCHERTHTKEKPFMCKFCGKGFSQHISVKIHEKIHEKLNSNVIIRRSFRTTITGEEDAAAIATPANPEHEVDDRPNDYEKEVKSRRGRPRKEVINVGQAKTEPEQTNQFNSPFEAVASNESQVEASMSFSTPHSSSVSRLESTYFSQSQP